MWGDAWATVSGASADGAEWAAVGDVWIGLPETGAVAVVDVVAGDQGLLDVTRTLGPTGYGGRLALVDGALWVGSPAVRQNVGRVQGENRTIDGWAAGDRLGDALMDCGDLTGDGLSEVLVGVPGWSGAPRLAGASALAGAVLLVRSDTGDGDLWDAGPVWWGPEGGSALGRAVACDADLDGDGVHDVVVGAPFGGLDDRGLVYLVSGAALAGTAPTDATFGAGASGSIADVASRSYTGSIPFGWAGSAFAAVDLTGSGEPELIVGAPGGAGAVLIYDPQRGDTLPIATVVGVGHLGRTLGAGDVDGDGRVDVVVGSPDLDVGRSHDVGRVDVLAFAADLPRSSSIDERSVGNIVGSEPFQRVGAWIGLADVDGDAALDVLLPTRMPAPE